MPVYGFDDKGMRRAVEAIRRVEATPVGADFESEANARRALVRRAILTTALTAATSSQAGSGSATIQQMNPATGAYTAMLGPTGAALPAQKVWNPFTGAGVSGRAVLVIPSGGQWIVIGYDCP